VTVHLANNENFREHTLKERGQPARRSSRRRLVRFSTAEASAKEVAVQNPSLSPNRRIPNGSWCLFREVSDGSRNGKLIAELERERRVIEQQLNGGDT
jgi:hypothetical protein